MQTLACADCRTEVQRRGPTQKYCESCSAKRDLRRKRLWSRSHSPSPAQIARNVEGARYRKERSREAGLAVNCQSKQSLQSYSEHVPELLWTVRVAVPFTYAASKNHIYALCVNSHVALRRESRAKRAEITLTLRAALAGRRVAHNKLWIDILVQKPNHRGDAVNVVDLVCDAVKDAVPVDDRWFSIRRLDWEIAKEQPQLIIGIGQESDKNCQVCSYCGQIKEFAEFNRSKHRPLGFGRECRDCRRSGRLLGKEKARAASVIASGVQSATHPPERCAHPFSRPHVGSDATSAPASVPNDWVQTKPDQTAAQA